MIRCMLRRSPILQAVLTETEEIGAVVFRPEGNTYRYLLFRGRPFLKQGYGDLEGKTMPENLRHIAEPMYLRCLKGERYCMDYQTTRGDAWYRLYAMPLRSWRGRVWAGLIIVLDITESMVKAREVEALRGRERQAEVITKVSRDLMALALEAYQAIRSPNSQELVTQLIDQGVVMLADLQLLAGLYEAATALNLCELLVSVAGRRVHFILDAEPVISGNCNALRRAFDQLINATVAEQSPVFHLSLNSLAYTWTGPKISQTDLALFEAVCAAHSLSPVWSDHGNLHTLTLTWTTTHLKEPI